MAPFYVSFNSSRMWSSSSAFAVTQPGDKRTDPTVTVLSMQWCETQAWEHISVMASVILTFPSHAVGCIHPLLGWETGLSSGQVPLGGCAAHVGPLGFVKPEQKREFMLGHHMNLLSSHPERCVGPMIWRRNTANLVEPRLRATVSWAPTLSLHLVSTRQSGERLSQL